MGLSEMLEKSSPIQVKRKKENASAFKSLANRNTELVDENKELKEEIERLNNIINEFEDILKRDIKACNNKFENIFDRNYRRLILEEKLEKLQELKGSNDNDNDK